MSRVHRAVDVEQGAIGLCGLWPEVVRSVNDALIQTGGGQS